VLITTQPSGTGASSHTSIVVPTGLSEYFSIVITLNCLVEGLPQLVGSQWLFTMIQPFGTGEFAQMSILEMGTGRDFGEFFEAGSAWQGIAKITAVEIRWKVIDFIGVLCMPQ